MYVVNRRSNIALQFERNQELLPTAMSSHSSVATRRVFDVAVVGGGVSGLSAALRLSQVDESLSVGLLEADESRLGGRVRTTSLNGQPLELGAQWIHGRGENPLWKFAEENKVSKVWLKLSH